MKRHYTTLHAKTFRQYSENSRQAIITEYRKKLKQQTSFFKKSDSDNKCSIAASYKIELEIAKAKKPFSDGVLIKKCAIEMAKQLNELNLAEKLGNSLNDFSVAEEMLDLIPLHGTTKGTGIFEAVNKLLSDYGGFDKCSCIVTDGARVLTETEIGFAGLLKQNSINCPMIHCLVHQESLCGKSLRQINVMKVAVKITNIVRGGNRALAHREFRDFLAEVDATYGDLLLHTDKPLTISVENVSRADLQLELCHLQSDPFYQGRNETGLDFLSYCQENDTPTCET
ncbi:unnamed protein product [Acanthoscelides obtectus]|uniref:Uncharacterized protein n=1 Tax=Acanthoscelides obtectus TaxID=200917 RepID=A0A9P0KTF5_ACAOB|nr:unnamed protein product [Acanthoscelides obtectus]CAK1681337.1 General transcription factor II-I repeat domain-containing protein 2 [Acanthoscelides obtectus]